jgi:hypothetical protein
MRSASVVATRGVRVLCVGSGIRPFGAIARVGRATAGQPDGPGDIPWSVCGAKPGGRHALFSVITPITTLQLTFGNALSRCRASVWTASDVLCVSKSPLESAGADPDLFRLSP